jgi:DNA-directed RNA polymerase specialized sigma24 family protein
MRVWAPFAGGEDKANRPGANRSGRRLKTLWRIVRDAGPLAHTVERIPRNMPRSQPLPLDPRTILAPAETALALELVTEMDLLRLKTIARLHARGLPPEVGWDDLLQEAITRVLVGSRKCPQGVPMIAFLAGIMRSLKTEYWRRAGAGSAGREALRIDHAATESPDDIIELRDPAPDPERALSARQELAAIAQLFADDPVALRIIAALGEGLSAEQICASSGLSRTDYTSARRRMRRTLLREGLTCQPK